MGLFIWDSQPSKIFLGDTPISKVFLWDTQVRPAYQQVEYIQSSWTQYIDTWLAPSNNTKVQFKLSNYSINSSIQYVFGSTSKWWNKMFWLLWTTSWSGDTRNWHLLYGTSEYKLSSGNIGNWWTHTWELSSNWFYVDWTRIRTVSWTFTWTLNMTIFAWNINGIIGANERGSFKLYYFKVYESWTLVRDFIPCYRKSDSVIWLYDRVNNSFYTNSWTWTFTKWGDI